MESDGQVVKRLHLLRTMEEKKAGPFEAAVAFKGKYNVVGDETRGGVVAGRAVAMVGGRLFQQRLGLIGLVWPAKLKAFLDLFAGLP